MKSKADASTIKIEYLTHLLQRNIFPKSGIVINEFSNLNCGARADLAIQINNEIHAIEIKSGRDSVRRLESQLNIYLQYFDRVTIVLDEVHFEHSKSLIAKTTAGLILYKDGKFVEKKRSKLSNIPNKTIHDTLLPANVKKRGIIIKNARALLLDSIQKRYKSNITVTYRIAAQGFVSHKDLEDLNPNFSKRKDAEKRLEKNEQTWSALVQSFKDQPSHLRSIDPAEHGWFGELA